MPFTEKLTMITHNIKQEEYRSLLTIVGCIIGFILGIYLVSGQHLFIPIIGDPKESFILKLIAISLATGTGGNLFSYIGGCIDIIKKILTVEKKT